MMTGENNKEFDWEATTPQGKQAIAVRSFKTLPPPPDESTSPGISKPGSGGTLLESLKIDLSIEVPDPHPLFSTLYTIMASPGNILVLKGGAKAAKSFYCSMLIASFISGKSILSISADPLPGKTKVIWLDTEQSKAHVHKLTRRIHQLAGLSTTVSDSNLEVYYLKELTTAERLEVLKTVVNDPTVGIVVCDGIIDLISDFNDLKESTEFRDMLLKMVGAKEILLIVVIHTNKKDNNSRGHIGAMLEQKSESTIQLSVNTGTFTAEGIYTRNEPFHDLSFIIENGMPRIINANSKEDKTIAGLAEIERIFRQILDNGISMPYNKLVTEYIEQSGKAERTAKSHIKIAISHKWIKKDFLGNYTITDFQDGI